MKFKTGDTVKVMAGKDKGMTAKIIRVLPEQNTVVVEGANLYTRHVKPYLDRPGEKVRRERAMSVAKVAIVNDKGQPDRIGVRIEKDGTKVRVYKKTGAVIDQAKQAKAAKPAKADDKKASKK